MDAVRSLAPELQSVVAMRTTTKVLPLCLTFLFGCADTGAPEPGTRIELVSASSQDGLVVRYATPELEFTLEGWHAADGTHSQLRGADGELLTELVLGPAEGGYGSAAMLAAVDARSAHLRFGGDAVEYQLAVETLMPYLTSLGHKNQGVIDQHVDVVLNQVLLLAAIGGGGVSVGAPCPEYLSNPGKQPFHTQADHVIPPEMLDQLDADKLYHWACFVHDVACYNCGSWLCGWECEAGNLDCAGRCGGGCG